MQTTGGAALSAPEVAGPDTGPADVSPAGPGRARGRALAVLAVGAVLVLVADVTTKQLAVTQLSDRGPVRLLGGAVYLVLVRNSGAAFSLGTNLTFVFPLITFGVLGWIGWAATRLRSVPWAVALGLVLGGALGNLGDRLFRAPGPLVGHVVDFVSVFDDAGQVFPVFNVADSALCVGVVLAVLLELTGRRRDGSRVGTARGDSGDPGAGVADSGG